MTSLSPTSVPRLGMLATLLLLPIAGCGGDPSPVRYEVAGTVVFAGKPVPAGEVTFQPDGARGNAGPGSIALIKDGRYQTAPDKGVVGGPYLVTVMGFDGIPVGDSLSGRALFPPYELKVEFPTEDTKKDFTVPASVRRQSKR